MKKFDSPSQLRARSRLPAKLVFDTAGRAAAAGTRRGTIASRHLLYEVDDLCLDLRLDRPHQSSSAVIVGQLADRNDPLQPLAGLPVFLVAGDRFLAQTTSNRLGEFRVEYETETKPSLCLPVGEEGLIEVSVEPDVQGPPGSAAT